MKLKTADECIKYLEKRIQNNQNIIEVNYFNSIIYYIAALFLFVFISSFFYD